MQTALRNMTLALALLAGLVLAGAAEARRLALVIGIDDYANVTDLQKARNDARAVSAALDAVGFEVVTALDPSRREFNIALSRLAGRIEPGDEVVFYFAGHGVEVRGRNYLLPADVPAVRPGDETLLTAESIAADDILRTVQTRGARMTFLVLDACRNNPFPKSGTRSVGGAQGLARMDPPEGAFILYSAGTGQTALDRLSDADPNPNSVFTRALLPLIGQPGLALPQLTRQVRTDVRRLAQSVGHEQFPAYYDQMAGTFHFRQPGGAGTDRGAFDLDSGGGAPVAPVAPVTRDPCAEAATLWTAIKDSQSAEVFESYVDEYGACDLFAALARERLAAIKGSPVAPAPSPPVTTPQSPVPSGDICFDLWYQRNAIFHRYGYCFQTAKAKQYFDVSNCTTRSPQLSAADLREVERLRTLERQNGC